MHIQIINRVQKKKPTRVLHRPISPGRSIPCNLAVIAIRLDQSPAEVYWSDRVTIDESGKKIGVSIYRAETLASRQLIIGAVIGNETRQYAIANIKSQRIGDNELHIEASLVESDETGFFSAHNLTPRINATQFQFRYGVDESVLRKWESIGVLRPYLIDRVLVCPDCESIPTIRSACPRCHSARFTQDRLIHHFACANVDRAESFQSMDDSLQCPKCRTKRLIVGVDFEYIDGPLTCFDCDHSGTQPTLSCLCHRCTKRFEPSDSLELELYGYHVNRLDPLAFVATSK